MSIFQKFTDCNATTLLIVYGDKTSCTNGPDLLLMKTSRTNWYKDLYIIIDSSLKYKEEYSDEELELRYQFFDDGELECNEFNDDTAPIRYVKSIDELIPIISKHIKPKMVYYSVITKSFHALVAVPNTITKEKVSKLVLNMFTKNEIKSVNPLFDKNFFSVDD